MSLQEQSLEGNKHEFDSTHVEEVNGDENVAHGEKGERNSFQGLKDHPKVLLFCLFANLGALMYGFDNLALSVCLSMPAFQQVIASKRTDRPSTNDLQELNSESWSSLARILFLHTGSHCGMRLPRSPPGLVLGPLDQLQTDLAGAPHSLLGA